MQQPPHFQAAFLYLLLIPLVIWLRLRRARRAARTSDLWFEPEGDHYIYHPFGWIGAAYLVSASVRDAIRVKVAGFARTAGIAFVLVAIGPIFLLGMTPEIYQQWRPWIVSIRIGLILALLLAGILWHFVAVRPFYADAPLAPRRISRASIREKQAALRSWGSVGVGLGLMLGLSGFFLFQAYDNGSKLSAAMGILLAVAALFNLRTLLIKLRQRGQGRVGSASGEIGAVDPGIVAPIEPAQGGFGRREG